MLFVLKSAFFFGNFCVCSCVSKLENVHQPLSVVTSMRKLPILEDSPSLTSDSHHLEQGSSLVSDSAGSGLNPRLLSALKCEPIILGGRGGGS